MHIPTQLYGIIGYPLGHSLSPLLHDHAFQQAGIPGVYLPWSLTPDKLDAFFQAVRTLPISGGNITIPHKQAAMRFMDRVSAQAAAVGAINTFFWDGDQLCGENTDIIGFLAPLRGRGFHTALVLGAGGAARALVAGLRTLNVTRLVIANRTLATARALARDFQAEVLPWEERGTLRADIVVNATSLGMQGAWQDMTPYPTAALSAAATRENVPLAYDIVYNPLETRFLREARAAGWECCSGLTMFVEQARAAFTLWTGTAPDAAACTTWVCQALGLQQETPVHRVL